MVDKGEFLGCHASAELYRMVYDEARRRNLSVSCIIREALYQYLMREGEVSEVEKFRNEVFKLKRELADREVEVERLKNFIKLKEREMEELKELSKQVEEFKCIGTYTSEPASTLRMISERLKQYRCYLNAMRGDVELINNVRKLIDRAAFILENFNNSQSLNPRTLCPTSPLS